MYRIPHKGFEGDGGTVRAALDLNKEAASRLGDINVRRRISILPGLASLLFEGPLRCSVVLCWDRLWLVVVVDHFHPQFPAYPSKIDGTTTTT
ncbi:hypothetical protein CEP54_006112 [Fusarium duplospermum]|uniref:Uncharacterized protein n=1 Tax=Fusarium duplospermum TaxID=1325734 RepID=A0A428Q924_9HYPO|nr:hypothetical protein CEP54_006112 [Fusarium duplospermum]